MYDNIYRRELPEELRATHRVCTRSAAESSCTEIPERDCGSQQVAEIAFTV